jgi:hypothetical protein
MIPCKYNGTMDRDIFFPENLDRSEKYREYRMEENLEWRLCGAIHDIH